MKYYLSLSSILLFFPLFGQNTPVANSEELSDHLNLEAIASIFSESEDLEDFEKRINDTETSISNLDLNEDGEVDYLRVVEVVEEGTHLAEIQAVVGEDQYQDVATIEIEKDAQGNTQIQIVGDEYIYGPYYIIEPTFVVRPPIYKTFWVANYKPWRSPYRWRRYPKHFAIRKPYPIVTYRKRVALRVNIKHSYTRVTVRRSARAARLHRVHRRNDYGIKHANRSHAHRHRHVKHNHQRRTKRRR